MRKHNSGNEATYLPNTSGNKSAPRKKIYPSEDVVQFLELLHPDGVFEIRVPNTYQDNPRYRSTSSGYFNDHSVAAQNVAWEDEREPDGIYVTLNPVEPGLLARSHNEMDVKAEHTTKDADVLKRRWLLIDIDPVRPAGISSNKAEMKAAISRAKSIREWLTSGRGNQRLFIAFESHAAREERKTNGFSKPECERPRFRMSTQLECR